MVCLRALARPCSGLCAEPVRAHCHEQLSIGGQLHWGGGGGQIHPTLHANLNSAGGSLQCSKSPDGTSDLHPDPPTSPWSVKGRRAALLEVRNADGS